MHLRSVISMPPPVILAREEHGAQGRDAELCPGLAREEREVDLQRGLRAGRQVKAIGARGRLTIKKGVDGDAVGAGLRRLNPEFAEEGRFLSNRAPIHDEPAIGDARTLTPTQKAESAGAQKRDRLVEAAGVVERG